MTSIVGGLWVNGREAVDKIAGATGQELQVFERNVSAFQVGGHLWHGREVHGRGLIVGSVYMVIGGDASFCSEDRPSAKRFTRAITELLSLQRDKSFFEVHYESG